MRYEASFEHSCFAIVFGGVLNWMSQSETAVICFAACCLEA